MAPCLFAFFGLLFESPACTVTHKRKKIEQLFGSVERHDFHGKKSGNDVFWCKFAAHFEHDEVGR